MLDLCGISRPLSGFHGRSFGIQGGGFLGVLCVHPEPGLQEHQHLSISPVTLTSPGPYLDPASVPSCTSTVALAKLPPPGSPPK